VESVVPIRALQAYAASQRSTLFTACLGLLSTCLHTLTSSTDMTIGTVVSHRGEFLPDILGFLANTLALRVRLTAGQTFSQLLAEANRVVAAARQAALAPFDRVVDALGIERSPNTHPLFQVFLLVLDADRPLKLSQLEHLATVDLDDRVTAKFDLLWKVQPRGDGTATMGLTFASDLFTRDTAQTMLDLFVALLSEDFSQLRVGVSSPSAYQNLLLQEESWNATQKAFPQGTLLDLFQKWVKAAPDRIACEDSLTSLTYRELSNRVDSLASALIKQGVEPGDRVATLIPRSVETMVTLLAILKAGAAYVPLSTQFPASRLSYILNDTQAKLVLTTSALAVSLQSLTAPAASLLVDSTPLPTLSQALDSLAQPQDLAYVLYTSGTTGQPKGVMIRHFSVVNRLVWMRDYLAVSTTDVILQKTPLTFDVSVWELFFAVYLWLQAGPGPSRR
jgi:fengycin family lipopeptide synthetase D